MTFNDFQQYIAKSLAAYMRELGQRRLYEHLTLGIYEETGEVTSQIRRTIPGNYHQQEIDKSHLSEEIGDVLWYISQIASQLSTKSLEQIAKDNLRKTYMRYKGELFEEDINMISYAENVKTTYRKNLPEGVNERATFLSLGLVKEIGEICRLFGEYGIDTTELRQDKVQEKLGDALWYLTAIADTYGLSLEEIAVDEVFKLPMRYNSYGLATNLEAQSNKEQEK